MHFQRRLSGKPLAELCHRLAISAESGIDIRRTWEREAANATGGLKATFRLVRQGVEQGDTLTESLSKANEVFPRLFLKMVEVGEKTGCLPEVLHRLSAHYQHQHEMGASLRASLAWPCLQLLMAVGVIGLILVVFASLGTTRINGEPLDLLGFGVGGWAAVTLYVQILIGCT
ncbi:MAG: type II secretion system F family protein, partial [Planctomycetota bacterium]